MSGTVTEKRMRSLWVKNTSWKGGWGKEGELGEGGGKTGGSIPVSTVSGTLIDSGNKTKQWEPGFCPHSHPSEKETAAPN